jgi:pimeloyl-ACP methyl ester carboxylesterase
MSPRYHAVQAILASLLTFAAACAHAPAPRTITTPAGPVYVDDGGKGGIPVVFVHGNGGSSAQWKEQLGHLRATRRALAIDLPGMGQSPAPAGGDYSLRAMAAAIDAVTRELGLRRFVLVGHSYAGAVVATYAARHGERLAGVVYADAAAAGVTLSAEQKKQLLAALRADKMAVVRAWFAPMLKPSAPAVRDAVFASVEKTTVEAFSSALFSLGDYDAKTTVNAFTGPRFAIGASDIEAPSSFHKVFPEIQSVRIEGAGHWLMLDKPEAFDAALDGFLATLR